MKDTNGSSTNDDNLRKAIRLKKSGKKLDELTQTKTLPTVSTARNSNSQGSPSHRGKTLSDSNISAVQYVTPSINTPQMDHHRQRPTGEYSSSMPTTTGNVHHKKARK